jgi:putative transposase
LVDEVDVRLKSILCEVAEETDSEIIELKIMPDHVHLLVECDPQFGIHKRIRMMKGTSSRYLRSEFPWLKSRSIPYGRKAILFQLLVVPRLIS